MGRAGRPSTTQSASLRAQDITLQSDNLNPDAAKVSEDLLASLNKEQPTAIRNAITRELLALALHKSERPEHEKASGLEKEDRSFRLRSPLLLAVSNDPRFAEDLQIMVDLDSTLFPMDGAMREMGVHLPVADIEYWQGGDSDLIDSIMVDYWDRPDLRGTGEEYQEERMKLLGEFFARMHTSAPRMIRSGVFEYAPQLLRMLHLHGVQIHVFTHRDLDSEQPTREWLGAMGIPYDHLRVEDPAKDKEKSDKIRYCTENHIPVCIDDKPDTILRAEETGIEAVSLEWKYAEQTIRTAGADAGGCWRELGESVIEHLEAKVRARAEREGITLPEI